jgi:hypothetical protein
MLKTSVGILLSDVTQDDRLSLFLFASDAAIKKYVKRNLELSIVTEYPYRLGGEAIVLEQTPVQSYRVVGSISSGSAQITNLVSTTNLLVGMTAIVASNSNQTVQPFPNAATIISVDSTTQVTMSAAATANVPSVPINFGCSVWYDPNGGYGDGPGTNPGGPYAAPSLLLPGIDYSLQRDSADGMTSNSGKLIRLASVFAFLGMGGAWNPYGSTWGGLNERATLSAPLKPLWPNWPPGSIRVMYAAGYTSIPQDLTTACNGLATWMWRNAVSGLIQMSRSSFNGYSASIIQAMDWLKAEGELGGVRAILSHYRKVAI